MFLLLAFFVLNFLSNESCVNAMGRSAAFVTSTTFSTSPSCRSTTSKHPIVVSSSSTTQEEQPTNPSPSENNDDAKVKKATLTVALTRELGKNSKIRSAVENHPMLGMLGIEDLQIVEMPCIQHARGENIDDLTELLKEEGALKDKYQYVVVTSPEAAKVLGEAMKTAGLEEAAAIGAKVVAVGKATEKALKTECNLSVDFVPSKANGETLALELPPVEGVDVTSVLYPASAKAADTIQEGLTSRTDGTFQVTRLNTYDTIPATFDEEQTRIMMEDVDIACFGSPSAVEAWLGNVDVALGIENLPDEDRQTAGNGDVLAACIGTTTAKACLESRRWESRKIYYPKENPGMEGWAESTGQALGDAMERKFWGGGW